LLKKMTLPDSSFDDVKTQTSPDTGLTTNTYDSGGNLKTSTDTRNAITTYGYDALNRVSSAAYKIGSTTEQVRRRSSRSSPSTPLLTWLCHCRIPRQQLVTAPHRRTTMAISPGTRFGSYEVTALIGVGGMGEVYRARDQTLKRDVALKLLPEGLADANNVARLRREAEILASLNHANVAQVYGLESDGGGRAALVMELIDGLTLAERIGQGRLQPSEALAIAAQVASALEAAHEQGIVHRDLKPTNIKVKADGTVKVFDFGIAKALGAIGTQAQASTALTEVGSVLGTAPYMSPEQARGNAVDKRADVWAFGCVLYEMLTGRPAFLGDDATSTLARVLERDPDMRLLPGGLPSAVRRTLELCLQKDPRQRLRDMGDARLALEGKFAATDPQPRPIGRHALPVTAVLLIGALGAGTYVATLARPQAQRGPVTPVNPLAEAQFTRFTDFDGAETDAAISRDGRFVAFRSNRDGTVDTWLSQVGTGRFINMTPNGGQATVLVDNVGFTPDGAELWLAGIIGGARLRLLPISGGTPRAFLGEHTMNVAWSPDGTRLVAQDYDAGDPLTVADATGANGRQIYVATPPNHAHFPTWSTDGQWIYFVGGAWDARRMDIWRIWSEGGEPEKLTDISTDVKYLAPIDARTILYSAPGKDGSGPWLWSLDPETRETHRVSYGLERYTSIEASGDGLRLVATVDNSSASLWAVPLADRMLHDADIKPFPLPSGRALAPRYGGSALFYLSSRGVGDGLWRFQDGQALEIWRGADGPLQEPGAPSPDSKRLAIILRIENRRTLHTISSEGGDLRKLAESVEVGSAVSWSPDGAWILAAGTDAEGPGLFKVPVNGGAPARISKGAASHPVWSPDGSVIAYLKPIAARWGDVQFLDVDTGQPIEAPSLKVRIGGERFRFMPGKQQLVYMLDTDSTKQSLWLYDLASKRSRQIGDFDMPGTRTFDITPDGNQLIFDRLRESSDIVLIDLPEKRESESPRKR
jgi:YD repeat-containing protein